MNRIGWSFIRDETASAVKPACVVASRSRSTARTSIVPRKCQTPSTCSTAGESFSPGRWETRSFTVDMTSPPPPHPSVRAGGDGRLEVGALPLPEGAGATATEDDALVADAQPSHGGQATVEVAAVG